MRTETITVYSFNELSDEAKQTALNGWRESNYQNGYAWENDNRESLKAFCDLFNVTLDRYNNPRVHATDEILALSGVRLMAYLWNNYGNALYKPKYIYNIKQGVHAGMKSRYSKCQVENSCVLTGYCMDDDILQPVYEAMHKPYAGDFQDLISECIQAYETAVEQDHDYQDSLEYCAESCEANEYEFTEDGKRY